MGDARAEEPRPTQETLASTTEERPLDINNDPKTRMRNPDLFVAGLVLSFLAGGCFIAAISDLGADSDREADDVRPTWILSGFAGLALGVPAMVYGAKSVPVDGVGLLPSRLAVGAQGVQAAWTF